MTPVLTIRNLSVRFGAAEAVSGVSMTLHEGRTLAVVGESGSGKSVTALAAIGLLPPNAKVASGTIELAAESGPVVPLYIWSPEEEGDWAPGGAGKWWLHRSLESLDASLRDLGSRLIIRHGDSLEQLREVVEETGAARVLWNRRYEPHAIERDKRIKLALAEERLGVESFNAALLHEPWTVSTQQGTPYKVFTPYWKACLKQDVRREPVPKPKELEAPEDWPESAELDDLGLNPSIDWDEGLQETWEVGEEAATKRLKAFAKRGMADYGDERNRMDHDGVSMLSP